MIGSYIDLIIRIKNGYMSSKKTVEAKHSKLCENILKILKREKYIANYKVVDNDGKKNLSVELLYDGANPTIRNIQLISKPGRRIYMKSADLKPVLGGLGISILSTPLGIITNREAIKQKTGGEVLFNIW